jgi:hypothetical protein
VLGSAGVAANASVLLEASPDPVFIAIASSPSRSRRRQGPRKPFPVNNKRARRSSRPCA